MRGEDQKESRPQKRPRDVPEIVCSTVDNQSKSMIHDATSGVKKKKKTLFYVGTTDAGDS